MSLLHRPRLPVHRLLCLVLAAALPGMPALAVAVSAAALPSATEAPAVSDRPTLRCEPPRLSHDRLNLVCVLDASEPQRVHVKVDFGGSHDDTNAALEVTLGDTPVACDAVSKTSSEGEDGEVTLDCRFTVAATAGAGQMLRASARWFHARYLNVEVHALQP